MSATSAPVVPPLNTRPGFPLAALPPTLFLLSDLQGTWVGDGINVMSLPDFDPAPPSNGPFPFRVKLNSTIETLQFTPIGGVVPNRGVISAANPTTGQPDIKLTGLSYMQRVSDFRTNEALHIEPGFWLNVPATTVAPVQPAATIARLATIPHGDAMMVQGAGFSVSTGPVIADANSLPLRGGEVLGSPYTVPFQDPPLPPNFKLPYVLNPNLKLKDDIDGYTITKTTVLILSTSGLTVTTPPAADPNDPNPANTTIVIADPKAGFVNIPFVVQNANATAIDAIFWIETVLQPDGTTFQQLQYTQRVILNFLGIDWPHISVATLVKQ